MPFLGCQDPLVVRMASKEATTTRDESEIGT